MTTKLAKPVTRAADLVGVPHTVAVDATGVWLRPKGKRAWRLLPWAALITAAARTGGKPGAGSPAGAPAPLDDGPEGCEGCGAAAPGECVCPPPR